MLDIRLFRDEPDFVRTKLAQRNADPSAVDRVLALDEKRRGIIHQTEAAKARRNEISKTIPIKAKAKEPIDDLKEESRKLGDAITAFDADLGTVDRELEDVLMRLPNLASESTPVGDETANAIVRTWGTPVQQPFAAKPHWELGEKLGILDLPRATKISGSGFYALKGLGARLERALIGWMLNTHTAHNGYTELSVPFIVNRAAVTGTNQLPKFEEDLYRITEDDLFLVPTAEVPVTNLHAQEILEHDQLPIAYCAHTPCFRREAGSAGKENRGISRIHQFHKVELVHIVKPEDSVATHERLVGHAEGLLQALGIPYRVVLLSSGDMGFGAAKCYDLEIWASGMKTWLEVSSCSNFEAFQARRANIRYRAEKGAKPSFAHTLNGSGLALPRLVIAILENFQNEDGSVTIPEPLRAAMGTDRIG